MSTRIEVPQRLQPSSIAEWMSKWATVSRDPDLTISGLPRAWAEPAGVVALAAGCASRSSNGTTTRFDVEEETPTISYLRRMDFFRVLGLDGAGSGPRRSSEGRFVELRRMESESVADTTARECEALLREQLPHLASSLRRYARNVIEELGVNIVQHSGARQTGFAMAQAWGGASPRLQIAAADAGIGFLASLQRNLELAGRVQEDGDALQIALTKSVSAGDPAENSGFGLEMLRHLADVLGADLRVVSGNALLHRRTVAGQRTTVVRPVGPWQGAWICLDAPLPAPKP